MLSNKNCVLALVVLVGAYYFYGFTHKSDQGDKKENVINAEIYEKDFYREFELYWENDIKANDKFEDVVNVPNLPRLKLEDVPDSLFPKKCLICRAITYSLLNRYQNESRDTSTFQDYLNGLCTALTSFTSTVCRDAIAIYLPTVNYILEHRIDALTSDSVCGILFQYNECSANKNLLDFQIQIDREPIVTKAKQYAFNSDEQNLLKIVHLTDFHYDPYYAAGSSSDCIEPICCRNTSTPKENSTETAGYWGDYHTCDSPGYLIENICTQLATNHKDVDFVFYTGDFADHFGWLTSKSSVKHSIRFITNVIMENFPNQPIAMIIGNHDIHPSDAFAPSTIDDDSVNSKWLYEFVAGLWQKFLPPSALETLRIGGYYTFIIRPGLRVVALNNNLCFTANVWLLHGSEEMQSQLQWLQDTLLSAENANEKVHILAHVPPNTASCVRSWNREFDRLIKRFAHIISGHFNGHTHADEFTLQYLDGTKDAVSVAWNGGSGTSFVGLNPNYRIYHAEPDTFEIIDHETWIFNLTEANLTPNQSPKWFKEYSFRDAFGVSDLSPATLHSTVDDEWRRDSSQTAKHWSFTVKQSDVELKSGCDEKCLEKLRMETTAQIENNFFQ